MDTELKDFLDARVALYNQPSFIATDPISIPHRFTQKQDIEIAGFFAALFAWGNRTIIINKCTELLHLMDDAPYDFIRNHTDADLKKFMHFKHRTFNTTDLLYFILFFITFEKISSSFILPKRLNIIHHLNSKIYEKVIHSYCYITVVWFYNKK